MGVSIFASCLLCPRGDDYSDQLPGFMLVRSFESQVTRFEMDIFLQTVRVPFEDCCGTNQAEVVSGPRSDQCRPGAAQVAPGTRGV